MREFLAGAGSRVVTYGSICNLQGVMMRNNHNRNMVADKGDSMVIALCNKLLHWRGYLHLQDYSMGNRTHRLQENLIH
jgi:hypothetical protein